MATIDGFIPSLATCQCTFSLLLLLFCYETDKFFYSVGQKVGPHTHDHNYVKSEPIKKITGKFIGKFVVKWILLLPPHLAYVATLPCETLMSAKQAINDKLQGSVATYLRCAGVVNNHIKKTLFLSRWVNFSQIGEYLAKLQARAWLSHALCAPGQQTTKRRRKCTRQSRSSL